MLRNTINYSMSSSFSSRESSILSDFSEVPIILQDSDKRPSIDGYQQQRPTGGDGYYRRPSGGHENGRTTYEDDVDYVLEKENQPKLLFNKKIFLA